MCSVSPGDDVTEELSVTPASNNDKLILGDLEPDLTLDCCKWAQTELISCTRTHT